MSTIDSTVDYLVWYKQQQQYVGLPVSYALKRTAWDLIRLYSTVTVLLLSSLLQLLLRRRRREGGGLVSSSGPFRGRERPPVSSMTMYVTMTINTENIHS